MVRGFSTRGQVPLYIDGIPISVPYDGYVDFNMYLTRGEARQPSFHEITLTHVECNDPAGTILIRADEAKGRVRAAFG
jgi:hypothetical protein